MTEVTEQLYQEVSNSIKLVFDLTSRIDERVKMLVEQHNDANQRIEKLMERSENVFTRISVLENKMGTNMQEQIQDLREEINDLKVKTSALEIHTTRHENKWQTLADFVFKVAVTLVGLLLAYRLGVK